MLIIKGAAIRQNTVGECFSVSLHDTVAPLPDRRPAISYLFTF